MAAVENDSAKREATEYYEKVVKALDERTQALAELDGQLEALQRELLDAKVSTSKRMRAGSLAAGAAFTRKTKDKMAQLEERRETLLDGVEKAKERLEFAKEDLAEFE